MRRATGNIHAPRGVLDKEQRGVLDKEQNVHSLQREHFDGEESHTWNCPAVTVPGRLECHAAATPCGSSSLRRQSAE